MEALFIPSKALALGVLGPFGGIRIVPNGPARTESGHDLGPFKGPLQRACAQRVVEPSLFAHLLPRRSQVPGLGLVLQQQRDPLDVCGL